MIDFSVSPQSVAEVADHVEQVRLRVLEAIREGMREGMESLAGLAASKVHFRTGALQSAILGSPKVTQTEKVIRGTVSSDVGGKHVGLWVEFGTHVPAVTDKLMVFAAPDGTIVFSKGHKAFDVPAHPFMNPSLDERKSEIIETIRTRMTEALNER